MINTIILLGRSGCGKDTQAELLKERYGHTIVSSGRLFRTLATQPTFAGKKISALLDKGGLPPSWLAEFLWTRYFIDQDPPEKMIFNGFPRRPEEARTLDEVVTWFNRDHSLKVVLIDISRREALTRLVKRGRADDDETTINERLDWFDTEVGRVIEYYKSSNRLIPVNGEQSIEAVFNEIVAGIEHHG
ncbi:MAG: nucleoside monophosphate kinase [bacterium]|nr:nucleoside monophosphate kinase [bacterium]MDZ4295979.1 nucleoside monophosphate kinase [Patescibacteria group bacterium]